jgi:transposase
MGRGPTITQEEVNKAQQLKTEGKKPKEIASKMQRSLPTVYKLLTLPAKQEEPAQ